MASKSTPYITLADLYLAYRKAKVEAFYENTHFHAIQFTKYEKNLDRNLDGLLKILTDGKRRWCTDKDLIGTWAYIPKSLSDFENGEDEVFYRALDPFEEWEQRFKRQRKRRLDSVFRLVIRPTVAFQIISALWILKVGHKFDGCIDSTFSYGNRLRRRSTRGGVKANTAALNTDCLGLFAPYFGAYRAWRENGLAAMQSGLADGGRVIAVTMDLQRFYHSIDPAFLLHRKFLAASKVALSERDTALTADLLSALAAWYESTPDYKERPEGGLPVGLSASKIIANVLLSEFDQKVVRQLAPLYYGRYVDDIFLVLRGPEGVSSGETFIRWLVKATSNLLRRPTGADRGSKSLQLVLPYAQQSRLIFSGSKQKIFNLQGDHGLDLIAHISEQIRQQSSEHRMLPELPSTGVEMAAKALLANSDSSLEADALRKADVVSIRRLGFALILRDAEAYARDLRGSSWEKVRQEFYGLAYRHLLTPRGLFDFGQYLHRVFGLMVACGDFHAAERFVSKFVDVMDVLSRTTTAGTTERTKFNKSKDYFAGAFSQVAVQASTVHGFRFSQDLRRLLRSVEKIAPVPLVPRTLPAIQALSTEILLADWGRRPYRDYWYYSQRTGSKGPKVPVGLSVRKVLRLGAIKRFRMLAQLKVPHWPALAFPTRPLGVPEIGLIAPDILNDQSALESAIWGLRGARVRDGEAVAFSGEDADDPFCFAVPTKRDGRVAVALTSIETTDKQWESAATGRPDRSLRRYESFRNLVNRILAERRRPGMIVFPECSIPRRWAIGIAYKLAQNRVSMIAGLEYYRRAARLRNDCLISLTTRWPGYSSSMLWLQSKLLPSHEERKLLKSLGKQLFEPHGGASTLPIYRHGNLCFGVLLCSDLTNIENRKRFQGEVDVIFALEWNKDVNTFGFLVESTAHDLHAFVVQVNNRRYGDSRVRTPYREEYKRDAVRVKGGVSDYYVIDEIDWRALRSFQRMPRYDPKADFKPLPIGYSMSPFRREK